MKTWVSGIVVVAVCLLFWFNYEICWHYWDYNIEAEKLPWLNLRGKIYSIIFSFLGVLVFINSKRNIRIITIPMLALFLGDLKDRILFDNPERNIHDVTLVALAVFLMILTWYNDKPRKRDIKGTD